ncbi:MAG: hypothetical protein JXA14_17025 [Anaerolineae bacterium]|nr:hypothetical protein [Anaerolineae bacterium]
MINVRYRERLSLWENESLAAIGLAITADVIERFIRIYLTARVQTVPASSQLLPQTGDGTLAWWLTAIWMWLKRQARDSIDHGFPIRHLNDVASLVEDDVRDNELKTLAINANEIVARAPGEHTPIPAGIRIETDTYSGSFRLPMNVAGKIMTIQEAAGMAVINRPLTSGRETQFDSVKVGHVDQYMIEFDQVGYLECEQW